MKYFSLLNDSAVTSSPESKIIPKAEFGTLLSAKEILETVEEQRKAFEIQLEEDKRKALERGYKDGYQEGLTEFNEHILHLDTARKEAHLDMQNQVLSFALKAAKKIVGEALTLKPETVLDIVRETLRPVREAHSIKIGVSKEDRALVEAQKESFKQDLDHVESLIIEERADVGKGGCIIETETGIINATLENQWRALEAAFARMAKQ